MSFGMNRIAFTGIASGIDTQAIINDLMRVKRMPLDRLHQKKQLLEWQQEDYREMNRRLDAFRRSFEALRLTSGYNVKKAVSGDDSIVSVKSAGVPSQSFYSVDVVQLAQAGKHASVTLQTQVEDATQTFSDAGLLSSFNLSIQVGDGSNSVSVSVEVEGTDTLNSLINKLNEALEEHGIKAELFGGNQLILKSTAIGTDQQFTLSVDDSDQAEFLGMLGENDEPVTELMGQGSSAKQAIIYVNGVELRSHSNTFTYDGMQFTVKGLTAGSSVNISVEQDLDALVDKFKNFVEEYNKLIDDIYGKLGEKRYPDYPPLTDEQKEALSDREIEKWEERARSGLLNNDPILRKVMNNLRNDLYSMVSGLEGFKHLSEIGITVGASGENSRYRYMENGKLYIDEDKLRNALSENLDDVITLMTNRSNAEEPREKYNETGIIVRLYESINASIRELNTKAGLPTAVTGADNSTITKNIRDINEDIARLQRRLMIMEERYWRQFTAMEKALAQLHSQGAWLAQQLGTMM